MLIQQVKRISVYVKSKIQAIINFFKTYDRVTQTIMIICIGLAIAMILFVIAKRSYASDNNESNYIPVSQAEMMNYPCECESVKHEKLVTKVSTVFGVQ